MIKTGNDYIDGFFWAKTMKVPYLKPEEREKLLQHLITKIGKSTN